ncbi:lytic transglycosylase [Steroidobacter denitrificans]|uniref:lytic transglycosylase n=1 Tax=Steroidobacter denitrificans TaxID=465721 RepID=UPI000A762D13|nr:LysM peptidoglycan-binding domain-containing protein [Steroidobacter denitrificans]
MIEAQRRWSIAHPPLAALHFRLSGSGSTGRRPRGARTGGRGIGARLLALTLALVLGGCGHLAQHTANDDFQAIEFDPTKLDEASIGTLGPEQIEDAIEVLDARTESQRPLVSELGEGAAGQAPDDLFERIRAGFSLTDVDQAAVQYEVDWFARHPAYLDRTFKRGERYLHHIVTEIEARGMPSELALLPVVESAFNPVAYSRARASGLWQFIPATGLRYGLKQNWYYDGRRDVLAATTAALDYLEALAKMFEGDWLLAVAAYNTGEANVARAIKRNLAAGKPTDFFHLQLPRETRAYVPKLLAMRRIVADPAAHGLAFSSIANQPYFVKVEVGGQIDLQVAAELAELSKEELLALNPAFNHWVTDPEGPHHLLVPVDRHDRFVRGIAALPPGERVRVVYHRVRAGDTLGAIANRYGVTVAALRAGNKLHGTLIHPGQDLLVTAAPGARTGGGAAPAAAIHAAALAAESSPRAGGKGGRHIVQPGDTLWSIARRHGVNMDHLARSNGLPTHGTLSVGQVISIPGTTRMAALSAGGETRSTTYVVRRGDNLSRIADQFRIRLSDLMNWNSLHSDSIIMPGQRLVMYIDERRRAGI